MNTVTVFVVDDDQQARNSVKALVRSMGVAAETFESAEEFLAAYRPDQPGCLVTDVRMFGMSGAELQDQLLARQISLPVIVMTAFAKTQLTVEFVKKGAITVLEKPYDDDALWDAIRKALSLDAARREQSTRRRQILVRMASLSDKETEVLERVIAGKANKVIAKELDISIRTVENRRREVFEKMHADSLAGLVRMVIEARDDGEGSRSARN